MSERLAAAAVRAEEQQAKRRVADVASAELTSVMPAINLRLPVTLPGQTTESGIRAGLTGRRGCRAALPGYLPAWPDRWSLAGTGRSGRRTVNVLPWPSVLSAVMAPPCASTMALAMASPRPVPGITCRVAAAVR